MARRPLSPEERRLWAQVARTVTPRPGRKAPELEPDPAAAAPPPAPPKTGAAAAALARAAAPRPSPPSTSGALVGDIEPNRKRRIARERDPVDGVLDLHGFSLFVAEDRLKAFVREAQARGARAVLVVTGKGSQGGGIIRDWAPTWLSSPSLREVVAGVARAHRRHGGEGALYVALKRRKSPFA